MLVYTPAQRAASIVQSAVKRGDLVRLETCELCGADCPDSIVSRTRAHHWRGYDYPLDVWFLCHRCNCLLKGDRFHNGSVSKEEAWQFIKSKLFPAKPTITRCEAHLTTGLRCKNKVTNGQYCHLHRPVTD